MALTIPVSEKSKPARSESTPPTTGSRALTPNPRNNNP
jgi:hypothetical protein